MSVEDTVRTVTVPAQAGPVDPPLAPAPLLDAPARTPLLGRDRPLTSDERQFLLGSAVLFVGLMAFIIPLLLLAQYVW